MVSSARSAYFIQFLNLCHIQALFHVESNLHVLFVFAFERQSSANDELTVPATNLVTPLQQASSSSQPSSHNVSQ